MRLYFLFFNLLVWHAAALGESLEKILELASANYHQGEKAITFLEREKAFNQALILYSELADATAYPSGELNQALANSYFQLEEYAWSILYNERALRLKPREPQILNHLLAAQSKMGMDNPPEPFSIWQKLLLNAWTAIGERLEIFFWLFFLSIIILTFAIWQPNQFVKKISITITSISLLLLFNLMLSFYFSPIEGILIYSTGYYREPDITQPQLTQFPKRAGTKMRILTTDLQGSWLKVTDSEGLIGYIPATAIRII